MILKAGGAVPQIVLDRTSPIPLYHQLFEQFAAAIRRGELRPGDTLEREDLLAERLQIARPTLRRALGELAALGLISRSRGHGTIVIDQTTPRGGVTVEGSLRSRILRFESDHVDPGVAAELGLGQAARLVYLEQVLVSAGRAVSLHRQWLPASLVDPVRQDLTATPFSRILSEVGHAVVAERRTFDSRPPDSTEHLTLDPAQGESVFTVCGVAYDRQGTPVLRTSATYLREIDQYQVLKATA